MTGTKWLHSFVCLLSAVEGKLEAITICSMQRIYLIDLYSKTSVTPESVLAVPYTMSVLGCKCLRHHFGLPKDRVCCV